MKLFLIFLNLNLKSWPFSSNILNYFFQRDKGAPLMCLNEAGVWQLYGLLSREGECQNRPHPDVFASVPASKTWIENMIGFKEN